MEEKLKVKQTNRERNTVFEVIKFDIQPYFLSRKDVYDLYCVTFTQEKEGRSQRRNSNHIAASSELVCS